jgi:hypothetical protein
LVWVGAGNVKTKIKIKCEIKTKVEIKGKIKIRDKVKTKTKIKIKSKGNGQECPFHTLDSFLGFGRWRRNRTMTGGRGIRSGWGRCRRRRSC